VTDLQVELSRMTMAAKAAARRIRNRRQRLTAPNFLNEQPAIETPEQARKLAEELSQVDGVLDWIRKFWGRKELTKILKGQIRAD
jgi:hypothetical protein